MNILNNGKKNNSIWLTGSRGFIGGNLYPILKDICSELKCFSDNKEENNISQKDDLVHINFMNKHSVIHAIDLFGLPDLFIHLGWGDTINPHSKEHVDRNVDMSKNLINTLYEAGLDKFVFIGSMNEYGDRIGPLSEYMTPTGKLTNYARGKIQVASFGFEKAKQTKKKFIHIRLFYTYGAVQKKNSLIQDLYQGGRKNSDTYLGACEHHRDYIHISEVVKGIQLISNIQDSVTVNLGSGRSIKVKDFALLFWKFLDADPEKLHFGSKDRHLNEQPQPDSFADLDRLKKLTGWIPSLSIEEGIKLTIKSLNERKSL